MPALGVEFNFAGGNGSKNSFVDESQSVRSITQHGFNALFTGTLVDDEPLPDQLDLREELNTTWRHGQQDTNAGSLADVGGIGWSIDDQDWGRGNVGRCGRHLELCFGYLHWFAIDLERELRDR